MAEQEQTSCFVRPGRAGEAGQSAAAQQLSNDHNHYNHRAAPLISTWRSGWAGRLLSSSCSMTKVQRDRQGRQGQVDTLAGCCGGQFEHSISLITNNTNTASSPGTNFSIYF